ncbi:hypothetical protein GMORB2_7168 [Geosmithia morbida]|uniref:Uncharacterized protein n=1 Tax=Geosmithia morbida TaxID=1094350 RepID=A0A9P4YW85_9HYPO|nr:uncharacterized protein GMORB2_7168 [Geosmithia morbida]KAF4122861.1 hypothetical protein GMORB2_7168 [Geosmithia morbida]
MLASSLLQPFLQSFGLGMMDRGDRVYSVVGLAVDVDPGAIRVSMKVTAPLMFTIRKFVRRMYEINDVLSSEIRGKVQAISINMDTYLQPT